MDIIIEAFRRHAIDWLRKPFDSQELNLRVKKALLDIDFRRMALTDSMTKIANKGTLYEYLHSQLISLARAYHNKEKRYLSLAILDIDDFKAWNDTFGHLEGDRLLKEGANYFVKKLRGTDLIARYGGEEFAIVMPEASFEKAFMAYHRLIEGFKAWQREGEWRKFVTYSAGIATLDLDLYRKIYGEGGVDLTTPEAARALTNILISCADKGLYKAKQMGKNACYSENCLAAFYEEVVKAPAQ